jgi:hypothetical protein
MLGALFGPPRVALRPNVTLIAIVCAALAFVNTPAAFQLDPVQPSSPIASLPHAFYDTSLPLPLQVLATARASRITCTDLHASYQISQLDNVRCMTPVELPTSRYYSVAIHAYFDPFGLSPRPSDVAVNYTCSMHICDCGKRHSCDECDISSGKEYPCRANVVRGALPDADEPSLFMSLVGFSHPSDTIFPISLSTKFVFKVYAEKDDDAVALERTLPPLGPWADVNGNDVWMLDPTDDARHSVDAARDAAGGQEEGGSGIFSRVACTGVTHDFEGGEDTVKNWDGHRGGGYMSSRQNVCVFHNLCVGSDGEMTMFVPPRARDQPLESSAYNEEKNHVGYIRLSAFESWEGRYSVNYNGGLHGDYPGWRPAVTPSSIPRAFRFANDAELHIFQRHTHFFQNYGHLLLDDLLAAFAGMQLFSLASLKAALVLMPSCPCCFPETASSLCARFFWNNDSIARAVFHGGVQPSTSYSEGTCFKTVLMGHSSALSSVYPNPLLSVVARTFRSELVMSVVGAGVRYAESQWQRGPQAALADISKEQVVMPRFLFCVLVCMCN